MTGAEVTVATVRGLSAARLTQIAELERRVVDADGGRLKLEWTRLQSRDGQLAEDVLAHDGERLVGFAGLYGPGPPSIEIAGMVDPAHRRRGIGGRLLDASLALCREQATTSPLLIVPRGSAGGRALALGRGASLDHSEHALVLGGEPTEGPTDPRVTLRPAQRADSADLTRVLTSVGWTMMGGDGDRLSTPGRRTLVIERDGEIVGTLAIVHDDDMDRVYGFAIDARHQHQGIGRDVLRRVCRGLRADGARQIGLEVEVDNDHALGLYTSLGFAAVATEDYWTLSA